MKLNRKQKIILKKHSEHHSVKHMDMMKKEMKNGKSFTKAHNKAQKKIGK